MPRRGSIVIAGVFGFDSVVRREGQRGRRISIPAPVARGLMRTGWNHRAPLRIAAGGAGGAGGVVWTAVARRMGRAIVVALPVACLSVIGNEVKIELWQAAPAAREYVD